MMTSKRQIFGRLALVALIQTGVLGTIVYNRLHLLRTGREIVLPVIPIDPRDIFRGDYVRLGYPISSFDFAVTKEKPMPTGLRYGGPVYVVVKPDGDVPWKVVGLSADYPKDVSADAAVLKGRITNLYDGQTAEIARLSVNYGFESFFVPEGTGKSLEQQLRDHKIETVIALGPDGTAAIKGLVVDGQRHFDPPLF